MKDARLTAIQLRTGMDVDTNVSTALRMLDSVIDGGIQHDLVCLPEMLTFRPLGARPTLEIALAHTHRVRDELSSRARTLGAYLVAGYVMVDEAGRTRNLVDVFDRGGRRLGEHRKSHLFDAPGHDESSHVDAGDTLTVIDTDFGTVGLIVCYELRFPEVARTLALAGAELLVVPNSWPKDGSVRAEGDLSILLAAAAVQNQAYVLHCNQVGRVAEIEMAGGSCILGPRGTVLAESEDGECVVSAVVDGAMQERTRSERWIFAHRRPELYRSSAVTRLK